jgi:hypothetical protein
MEIGVTLFRRDISIINTKAAPIYGYFYKAGAKKPVVRSFSIKKGITVAEYMDT